MDQLEEGVIGVGHCPYTMGSSEYKEYQEDRANILRILKKVRAKATAKDVESILKAGTSLSIHQKAVLLSYFENINDPSDANNKPMTADPSLFAKKDKSSKSVSARRSKSSDNKKKSQAGEGSKAPMREAQKSISQSLKKALKKKLEKLDEKINDSVKDEFSSGPKVSFSPDVENKPEKVGIPSASALPKKRSLKKENRVRSKAKSADSLDPKDKVVLRQEKDDMLMKDILEYFENPNNLIQKTPSQIFLASRPTPVLQPIRRRKLYTQRSNNPKAPPQQAKSASVVVPTMQNSQNPDDDLNNLPTFKTASKSKVDKSLFYGPPAPPPGQRPMSVNSPSLNANSNNTRESRVLMNKVEIGKFINSKRVQKNEATPTMTIQTEASKKINSEVNAALNAVSVQHKLLELENKKKSHRSLSSSRRVGRVEQSTAVLDSMRPLTIDKKKDKGKSSVSAGDKGRNGNELNAVEDILKSTDSKLIRDLLDKFDETPFTFEKKPHHHKGLKAGKKSHSEILKKTLSRHSVSLMRRTGSKRRQNSDLSSVKSGDLKESKSEKTRMTPDQMKLLEVPVFPKFPICNVLPGTKEWDEYWEKFNFAVTTYYKEMNEYSRVLGTTHEEDIKAYSEKAARMHAENALFKQSLGLNPKAENLYQMKITNLAVICGYVIKNNTGQGVYATSMGGDELKLEIDIRNLPKELIKIDNEFNLLTVRLPYDSQPKTDSPPKTLKLGIPSHVTTKDVRVSFTDEFLIIEGNA